MNSIEVKNLGGKDRRLRFNMIAVETYQQNMLVTSKGVSSGSTIYATFLAGLTGNAYAKNEDIDFTKEDVTEWVDEMYRAGRKDEIAEICKVWSETYEYREWLTDFQERVRATLTSGEQEEKPKKKVRSNSVGLKSTGLHLAV